SLTAILPASIFLGGFMSTLYPVSVAHAHDRMAADYVVAWSRRPLLVNGLGSVLGPLIGTSLMKRYQIDGVFYLIALAAASLSALAVIERMVSPAAPHLRRPFEILDPQAAPLANDRLSPPAGPTLHTADGE